MAQERAATREDQSVWNSGLFKIGVVMAVIGVAVGITEVAVTGVLLAGAGWATLKGKGK